MPSLLSSSLSLKHFNTQPISMISSRSGHSYTQRVCRRLFPASGHSTIFARRISWMPSSRGNVKVQHVKFVQPKGRFYQNKWFQRIIVWLICVKLIGASSLNKRKAAEAEDAKEESQTTILAIDNDTDSAASDPEPASQSPDEDEEAMEIDDENAWFFPLTWPRQKPSVPYKSSDDEWEEFCKLSENREQQIAVKAQVADFVNYVARHHPKLRKIIGTASNQTRYWIDIDYPIRYDEGYEMTGIVVTDNIIGLAVRDYDDSTVDHFRRVISTIPVVSAFWDVAKAMFISRDTLTIDNKKKHGQSDTILPGIPDLESSPELAKTLRTSVRQLRTRPRSVKSTPRGCVVVSGRVDVYGTKASVQFLVVGHYNPKKDAWAGLPVLGLGPIRPVELRPVG